MAYRQTMNKLIFCLLLLTPTFLCSQGQVNFGDYFTDQTLRVDYYHTGDAKDEVFALDKIYKQGIWAGNPKKCLQPFELGIYKVKLIDTVTNKVIYSKGYNSIFSEYQTIEPALNGVKKTFHESVLVPCPKYPVKLIIEKRAKNNILAPVYTITINPADYHIVTENFKRKGDEIVPVAINGNPHHSVDLVILSEGYTLNERDKFINDLNHYVSVFFSYEPYKSHKKLFNINGIFSPSEESGTDEPRQGIYKNTRFNSAFNTFDTDRYCLAEDNKSIRDVAAIVPYDAVLVMVNKNRYGGGGIYNWQTVFATGSSNRDYVFLHEFGHAFAGLADEYYTSDVAYKDIFVPGAEPLEPNITALPDTANVKWKQFLSPGIKVPTEWGKATFDSLHNVLGTTRDEMYKTHENMQKSGASKSDIDAAEKTFKSKISNLNAQLDSFLINHPLKNKVGVFEGANYLPKGYYRSTINSMMLKFNPNDHSYGIVNDNAITTTINYYTSE
jgi:hypothetical protein